MAIRRTRITTTTATFGPAYVASLDRDRITGQMKDIRDVMIDGTWRTLREIHDRTGHPESSISAQLRHLKKAQFGAYRLHKQRDRHYHGAWFYQLLPPLLITVDEQLSLLTQEGI